MEEKIEQISKEILELKPKSKIDFNKYFEKYGILEQNKFECFLKISKKVEGWISIKKKFQRLVEGLPYNFIYIKNKKRIDLPDDTPINKKGM